MSSEPSDPLATTRNSSAPSDQPERRRSPRFEPEDVDSLLGEVLDLSATGMRVLHEGRLLLEVGEEFDILLLHRERDVLLPVRVVRIEAVDKSKHAIGLELAREAPELQRRILAMQPNASPMPQAYMVRQGQNG